MVANSETVVWCPVTDFELYNTDYSDFNAHIFEFNNQTNEFKIENVNSAIAGTYPLRLKAFTTDYYDYVSNELTFDVEIIDPCARATFDLTDLSVNLFSTIIEYRVNDVP